MQAGEVKYNWQTFPIFAQLIWTCIQDQGLDQLVHYNVSFLPERTFKNIETIQA